MKRTVPLLLILLMAMTLVAGCGKEAADTKDPGGTGRRFGESTFRAAVFFGDKQAQHLIPEERELSTELTMSGVAAEVVKELLKGPTDPNLLRTIPSEVRLLDARVEDELATINLSGEVLKVRGAAAVQQLLGGLLLSLTDVGGIDRVQVMVEGKKDVFLDEGVSLHEPMGRPFYGDIPFAPDPNRTRYLQGLVSKNEQLWRTEVPGVLRFEGRGFGFPLTQLELAYITSDNQRAQASIPYRGTLYTIELTRNPEVKEKGVWVITGLTSHKLEVGAIEQPVYFRDRQAVNVIPERRSLTEGQRGLPTSVLEALLAGPSEPHLSKIFPAGTRLLRAVTVSDGVATVDLSGDVRRLSSSAESARMVDALVFSLTELSYVHEVQILIDGQKGQELGNFKLDGPIAREQVSEQYHFDPDRVAWLQARVDKEQDLFRLDPIQTLMWEGRAFGFTADLLKAARLEQQADGALASLSYKGREYVIEMGRNPGEKGIWFIKGIKGR